jgi:hypothetical protein
MSKKEAIAIIVPRETKEAVRKAAEADHRSMGSYVNLILVEFLQRKGLLPVKKVAK